MKKFLTVLLVIAVMFTFSFGTAFGAAYTPTDQTRTDLLKIAADELTSTKADVQTLKAQYLLGYTGISVTYDSQSFTISKDTIKGDIIDAAIAKINDKLDKKYN